jgi:VWFA-related protein
VELVTIEAIVLDKGGSPVRNLKKGDFHLFEDGKEQEIATFDEVTENAGQPPPRSLADVDDSGPNRGKVVLILFDDSHVTSSNLKITRDSAEKYVKEHMRPQDLFAVASYGSSLKILQNFIHDGAKVVEAIRQPAVSSAFAASRLQGPSETESPDLTRGSTRIEERPIAASQETKLRPAALLRALSSLCSSIAPIKGRKTILVYSEAFVITSDLQNEFEGTINSAKRANVSFYTIDARGTKSAPMGAISQTPIRGGRSNQEIFGQVREESLGNILGSLADETGGLAIFNTIDFNSKLDKVDQELSNYYVLGFSSNNPRRDGKFRRIDVKTDVKGVTVRHRNGYFDPRPLDALADSKEEGSLMNAIASPDIATQLPVGFRAAYFYDSPQLARIPVSARVRTASPEPKKKGGQLGRDLDVIGVAYAEDGSVAARFSETLHIVLDKEKEDTYRKQGISYCNYFKLRPGKYVLKLAVADEGGKIGSAEQSLVVPPLPESGFFASSLVVIDQLSRLPDLIQNLQARLLDESDPLFYSGLRLVPSPENHLPITAPLRIFFKMYNLGDNPTQRNLMAQVQLLGEKGEKYVLPPIPLAGHLFSTRRGEASIALNLPFEKVVPGKYMLVVKTSEPSSNESITLQTDLQFQ